MAKSDLTGDPTPRRRTGRLLHRSRRFAAPAAAAAALLLPLGLGGAAPTASATTPGATTCGGTNSSPGTLAGGTYSSVDVTGLCEVDAGQVVVTGGVTVDAAAGLVAAYAKDKNGSGTSGLAVGGNITVATGGALIMGCEPNRFNCLDDNQGAPTLTSADSVAGGVTATDAQGVIIHSTTIGASAVETGGGGGLGCATATTGAFAVINNPPYSDYEDNTMGGNLQVTGTTSCWFGALRNQVAGSIVFTGNSLTDPDAMETLTNQVAQNLECSGNNPVVHYGDSGGSPNVVGGTASGECAFSVLQPDPPPSGPLRPVAVPRTSTPGYWLVARDGGIFSFGVPFLGSASGQASAGVAAMAAAPGGTGYTLAGTDGTAYGFGTNVAACSGLHATPDQPVVGATFAPQGGGCWFVASDGGVFAFGPNAPFFGSAGGIHLNEPIVGMAATPGGDGYYLVASDGGVFSYGPGARFQGSMGGQHLNQPIVGMAVDKATGGYWLIARDGGVFAFNAPFLGSTGSIHLNQPVVGAAATPAGDGYYLVASDGGVFCFGGAVFQGSTGAIRLNQPIVGMALG